MPQHGRPFVAFLIMTMSYSVLLGWAFRHTNGSVLIATLFHGAINLFQGLFVGAMDPATQYWLLALVYGVAALAVALRLGPNLSSNGTALSSNGTAAPGGQDRERVPSDPNALDASLRTISSPSLLSHRLP